MFKGIKNSKAQVGETLTWIVATIIIIVILIFFIFGASLFGGTKTVGMYFKESLNAKNVFEGSDPFLKKSLYTYNLLEDKNKKKLINIKLVQLEIAGKFNLDLNKTREEVRLKLAGKWK